MNGKEFSSENYYIKRINENESLIQYDGILYYKGKTYEMGINKDNWKALKRTGKTNYKSKSISNESDLFDVQDLIGCLVV